MQAFVSRFFLSFCDLSCNSAFYDLSVHGFKGVVGGR